MGFDIGNRCSGGKFKLCGGNYVGRVASALHLYMAILQDSFSYCYGTVLYCMISYPFRFSAQRQNSDLELLGRCWPWYQLFEVIFTNRGTTTPQTTSTTKASSPTDLPMHPPLRKSSTCALPCRCSIPKLLEPRTNMGGGESLYDTLGRKVQNSEPWTHRQNYLSQLFPYGAIFDAPQLDAVAWLSFAVVHISVNAFFCFDFPPPPLLPLNLPPPLHTIRPFVNFFVLLLKKTSDMTSIQRPCPSGEYGCTLYAYGVCCFTEPPEVPFPTSQTTEVPQSSLASTSSSSIYTPIRASLTSKTISTQQSATASPTQPGGGAFGPSSCPLEFFTLVAIGGVLVVLIIILTTILCRRHRKRRNSVEGLPTHGGVPEPFLDDGPVESISNPTPTHGGVPEPTLDDSPVESISNPTPNPALAPH